MGDFVSFILMRGNKFGDVSRKSRSVMGMEGVMVVLKMGIYESLRFNFIIKHPITNRVDPLGP